MENQAPIKVTLEPWPMEPLVCGEVVNFRIFNAVLSDEEIQRELRAMKLEQQ